MRDRQTGHLPHPALIPVRARPALRSLIVDGFGGEAVLFLEAGTLVDLVCYRLTLVAGAVGVLDDAVGRYGDDSNDDQKLDEFSHDFFLVR
jgi:hypothetical protein